MVKREAKIRRAKARSYVARCNNVVHEAPWTKGERRSLGGINIALELAELAHRAHGLRYESGISRTSEFPPRRFRWVYSDGGETDDCILVLDLETQRLAVLASLVWLKPVGDNGAVATRLLYAKDQCGRQPRRGRDAFFTSIQCEALASAIGHLTLRRETLVESVPKRPIAAMEQLQSS
jgi:hypothetical protein